MQGTCGLTRRPRKLVRRSHEHDPCIAPREHIDAEVLVVHRQRDRFNASVRNAVRGPGWPQSSVASRSIPRARKTEHIHPRPCANPLQITMRFGSDSTAQTRRRYPVSAARSSGTPRPSLSPSLTGARHAHTVPGEPPWRLAYAPPVHARGLNDPRKWWR